MIPGGYEDTPEGIWCKHCGEALNEPGHLCDRCAKAEDQMDQQWAESQDSPEWDEDEGNDWSDDDGDEWGETDPWEDDE